MRKALVEVFDDDARVVQHEIAVDQRGQRVVRIEVEQVFGKRPGRDVDDLDLDVFSASTMRVRWLAGSSGAENSVI